MTGKEVSGQPSTLTTGNRLVRWIRPAIGAMAIHAPIRGSLFNLALVVLSLLLSVSVLELAVRIWAPVPDLTNKADFYSQADAIGYALQENATARIKMREFDYGIRINSKGYRGPEFTGLPKPGTTRILLLGDSFTFGWGVNYEQTYGKVLEDTLNGISVGGTHEVINGGVPGFSTLNELLFLKHRGLALKPNVVVVQFLFNDDVEHNLTHPVNYRSVIDHTLVTTTYVEKVRASLPSGHDLTVQDVVQYENSLASGSLYETVKASLFKHSYLYRLLAERVPTGQVEAFKRFLRRLGLAIQHDDAERLPRSSIEIFEDPLPPRMEAALKVTERYFRDMRDLTRRGGVELVVVIFPGLFEVDRESRSRVLRRLGLIEGNISLTKVRARLAEFCRAEGIQLLDLLPGMQKAHEEGKAVYFPIDGHFNVLGYRLAGETVAHFLDERGLLKGPADEHDSAMSLVRAARGLLGGQGRGVLSAQR